MTQEERRACIAAASKLRSRPRLGQSGPLNGQHYSIRRDYSTPSNSHYGDRSQGRARHSVRAVRSQALQDRRARSDAPYQPDKMRIAAPHQQPKTAGCEKQQKPPANKGHFAIHLGPLPDHYRTPSQATRLQHGPRRQQPTWKAPRTPGKQKGWTVSRLHRRPGLPSPPVNARRVCWPARRRAGSSRGTSLAPRRAA